MFKLLNLQAKEGNTNLLIGRATDSNSLVNSLVSKHYEKNFRIRSFSGPYFPVFGLNTDRCSVSLRI